MKDDRMKVRRSLIGIVASLLLAGYSMLGYAQAASLSGDRTAAIVYLALVVVGILGAAAGFISWRRTTRAKSSAGTT
jgi:ABC-type xylose transport system permease subunit